MTNLPSIAFSCLLFCIYDVPHAFSIYGQVDTANVQLERWMEDIWNLRGYLNEAKHVMVPGLGSSRSLKYLNEAKSHTHQS
ncbi:hypothetical protein SLEP1_g55540 [Rubroshorea leprosula]|uniref:Secreted protein n=1 Tax=Rubroshorea leprosula TaxID=152421 RepID=A0AAV5MFM6_9ROSI|nr:hypothetical protein SLEP1_g55540 [Rubroshorea leprosula]